MAERAGRRDCVCHNHGACLRSCCWPPYLCGSTVPAQPSQNCSLLWHPNEASVCVVTAASQGSARQRSAVCHIQLNAHGVPWNTGQTETRVAVSRMVALVFVHFQETPIVRANHSASCCSSP
ncbi:hypothetical protein J4Q44_G00339560 [Coregonus suidteri]|uniref:Uncharacterized protein n=1 Tax=Coregonus suidteri TaxID=861788 RepID=A0AAN8KQR3_9TELE